jgi:anti-anti-sigma factor
MSTGATPEAALTEPLHPIHSHPTAMLTARRRPTPHAVTIVELSGEVDLMTENIMREALTSAARIRDLQLLICDMTHVSFFSCAGLRILLQTRAALHQRGAQLRVVAQSPMVILLFDVARLGGTVGLCASVQEAIRSAR